MDRQAALAWLLYAAVALALLGVSAAIVLFCQPRSPRASSLAALAGASTLSAAPLQVSSRLVSAVCVSALYLALLALFTAPVDVFLLENALPHVPASVRALRVLYKSYFVALALYSFVGAPLVYNYAKQTEMAHLTLRFAAKDRLLAALKRTVCFLVGLAFVLLMAMVLLLCGKPASSDIDWLKPLLQWSSDLETFLRLVTGILVLLGTYLWLFVSARGLASVPVVGLLMEDHSVDENRNTFQDLLRENALEAQATVQTKETILRRYEVTQQMSAADLERLQQLQLREQLLQERRDVLDANLQRFSLGSRLSCWKVPLGVLLLLLSLLLVASMLITTLDKMAHSSFKRGFLLNEPAFPNPVDGLLVLSSRFFPLDYVLFAVVFVYLFAVSLVVLARHGVAFLCFRLGRLQPRLTSSATMVVVSLVLAHVAFVGLFSVLTLAPQYATFGHQMYADEVTLCVRHCTLEEAAKSIATGSSHCRMSQLAHFYNALAVELPMFGTAFFLAQLAFCVLFVPWLAHAYLMAKRLPEDASDPKRERLLDNY